MSNAVTVTRKVWNEACQTDNKEYVTFVADLFYNELRVHLQDELSQHEQHQLKTLLEKSRAIIDKIKSKAHSGYVSY